ncbi:MAG: hypothetical protein KKA31_02935 [Candidatus Margulisbacteria bacterium]|nr:hypothetical protein [Candidatus Margulisiibacteriota bacterium]
MTKVLPIMLLLILGFFIFSAVNIHYGQPVFDSSKYYIDHGVADTGALNIVTSIYLGYRAYDTLGEATVFFAAALGVFMLLRRSGEGERD